MTTKYGVMMNIDKEVLRQVAAGEIEDPRIEVDIDGVPFLATGEDARYFATGILVGLKAMHPESNISFANDVAI